MSAYQGQGDKYKNNDKRFAFTIVELIVVIVVIGILAAVSFVAYNGIVGRAIAATIQSDLNKNKDILELYYLEHHAYPYALDSKYCPNNPETDNEYCLKVSNGNIIIYTGLDDTYELIIAHDTNNNGVANGGEISYKIDQDGKIAVVDDGVVNSTYIVAWDSDTDDYGRDVVQTADGGYAMTGERYGGSGDYDMYITKFDSAGGITWNRNWGETGNEYGRSLIETNDGNIIVVGDTSSFGIYGMFLAKYSSDGDLVWSRTLEGYHAVSIANTNDNGFVVTGDEWYHTEVSNMFLNKYDSNGDISWGKTWGGASDDYGYSVAQTSDSGFIVTGETNSFGAGYSDMFLAKYSSTGDLAWDKIWGGASGDVGYSIAQTSDLGFIVTGETRSFGAGESDMFLAKYSSTGDLVWDKTWGGTDRDDGDSLIIENDGSIIVAGTTWNYGAGGEGVFVSKFNSTGEAQWTSTVDFYNVEKGDSIIATSDGGYVLYGMTHHDGIDALFAKFNSAGQINNCPDTICKTVSVDTSDVSSNDAEVSATLDSTLDSEVSRSATSTAISAIKINLWNP